MGPPPISEWKGVPELLMAYDKHYGYVSPNPVAPTLPWIFHPVSTHEEVIHHYTHGMGIGDELPLRGLMS